MSLLSRNLVCFCALLLSTVPAVSAVTYADRTDFVLEDKSFTQSVYLVRPKGTLTIRRCSFTHLVRIDGTLAKYGDTQPELHINIDDITMKETLQIRYLNLTSSSSLSVKNVVGIGAKADHSHVYNYLSGTSVLFDNITAEYFWFRYSTLTEAASITFRDMKLPREGYYYEGSVRLQYNTISAGTTITYDGLVATSFIFNNIKMSASTVNVRNSLLDSTPLCVRINCDFNLSTSTFNDAHVLLDNVTKIAGTMRISGTTVFSNYSSFTMINSNVTHVEASEKRTGYSVYTASSVRFEDSSFSIRDTILVSKPITPDLYLPGSRPCYHLAIFQRSSMNYTNTTMTADRGNNVRNIAFYTSKTFQDGSTLLIDSATFQAMYGYVYMRNGYAGGLASPIVVEGFTNTLISFYVSGTYNVAFKFIGAYVGRFEFDPGSKFDGPDAGILMTENSRINTLRLDGTTTGLQFLNGAKIDMDGGRISSWSAVDTTFDGAFMSCRHGVVSAMTWTSGRMIGGSRFNLTDVLAYSDFEFYHDMSGASELHIIGSEVRYGIIFHASTITDGSIVNLTGNTITRNLRSTKLGEASAVHFKTGALTDSSFIVDYNTLTTTRGTVPSPTYAEVAIGVHMNQSVVVSGTSFVSYRGNKIAAKQFGIAGTSVLHEASTSGSSTVVAYSSYNGTSGTIGGDVVKIRLDGASRLDLGCVLEDVATLGVNLIGYDGSQRALVFHGVDAAGVEALTIDCAGAAVAGLITNSRFGGLALKNCAYSPSRPLVFSDVSFVTGNLEYAPASVATPVFETTVQLNVTFETAGKGIVASGGGVGKKPVGVTRPPERMLSDFTSGKFGAFVDPWNGVRCFPHAWFSYSASASLTLTRAPTSTPTDSPTETASSSSTPSLSASLAPSGSPSATASDVPTVTVTQMLTVSRTKSMSSVETHSVSLLPTSSISSSMSNSWSPTGSSSASRSQSSSRTSSSSATFSPVPTVTTTLTKSPPLTPSTSLTRSVGTSTPSVSSPPTTTLSTTTSKGTPTQSDSSSATVSQSVSASGGTPSRSASLGPTLTSPPSKTLTRSKTRSTGPSVTRPPTPTAKVAGTPSTTMTGKVAPTRTKSATWTPNGNLARESPTVTAHAPAYPTGIPRESPTMTAARFAASETVTETIPSEVTVTPANPAQTTTVPGDQTHTAVLPPRAPGTRTPTFHNERTATRAAPSNRPQTSSLSKSNSLPISTSTKTVVKRSASQTVVPCNSTRARTALSNAGGSSPHFELDAGNITVQFVRSEMAMIANGSALATTVVPQELYRIRWSRDVAHLPSDLAAKGLLPADASTLQVNWFQTHTELVQLVLHFDPSKQNFGAVQPTSFELLLDAAFYVEQEACEYEILAATVMAPRVEATAATDAAAALSQSFGTTTALASATLGASPAAAVLSLAVLSDMSCARPGLRGAVPHARRLLSPVADDDSLSGMLYGSILLTLLLPLAHAAATYSFAYWRGHLKDVHDRWFSSQKLLRFPSWSVAALAVLHQGMLYASTKLLFVVPMSDDRHGGPGALVAALFGLLWCIALPPLCVFVAARRVEATFVQYDFAASGSGRAPHVVLQRLLPRGRWETKAMSNAYGQLFAGFGSKYAAWAAFPFALPTVIVVCAVAEPTTSAGCARQYAALAALVVVHLCVVFVMRPYRAAVMNGLTGAASLFVATIGLSAAVQVASNGSSDGSASAAVGVFTILLLFVAVLWVVFAAFCFFFESRLTKRVTQRVEMRRILGRGWCWGAELTEDEMEEYTPALFKAFPMGDRSPGQSLAECDLEMRMVDDEEAADEGEDVSMHRQYEPPVVVNEEEKHAVVHIATAQSTSHFERVDKTQPHFGGQSLPPRAPQGSGSPRAETRRKSTQQKNQRKSSAFEFSWEAAPRDMRYLSEQQPDAQEKRLSRARVRRESAYDPFEASVEAADTDAVPSPKRGAPALPHRQRYDRPKVDKAPTEDSYDPFDLSGTLFQSVDAPGRRTSRRQSAFRVRKFDTGVSGHQKAPAASSRRRSSSLPLIHAIGNAREAPQSTTGIPQRLKEVVASSVQRGGRPQRRHSSVPGSSARRGPPQQAVVHSKGWVYLDDDSRTHSFSL